jgi:hypothetical protein
MATYSELCDIATTATGDGLRKQIKSAIAKAAQGITAESTGVASHTARLSWAKAALANIDAEVDRVVWYVLAANSAATVTQIMSASDAAVQSNVDAAIALFAS